MKGLTGGALEVRSDRSEHLSGDSPGGVALCSLGCVALGCVYVGVDARIRADPSASVSKVQPT